MCCTSVSRTVAFRENQKESSRLCTNSTSALTNTHVTGNLYLSILIKESAFKLRLFGGQLTSSQRWLDLSGTGYTRCCRMIHYVKGHFCHATITFHMAGKWQVTRPKPCEYSANFHTDHPDKAGLGTAST